MKKVFYIVLIIALCQFSNFIFGAIPALERAALIELFKNTNGDNWSQNNNWKKAPLYSDGFAMPGTEEEWFGVFVENDHVKSIYLMSNNLVGPLPSQLGDLTYIETLNLFSNKLNGSIPSELGKLTNLINLYFNGNQLTGTIPAELGNMTKLQYMYLYSNQLSGSIPAQLGNLSNLQDLQINKNQLSGNIPSQLGNLTNLTQLTLCENQLTGSIPSELGNLSKLEYLHLELNQLTGSIPKELGNSSNMDALILNNNQLSGSIPPELCASPKLSFLHLHNNQLTGEIPLSFITSNLGQLKIDNNCLTATDPTLLNWLNLHAKDWQDTQCSLSVTTPTISTNAVTSIGATSAVSGGNITSDGGAPITSSGIQWTDSLELPVYWKGSNAGSTSGSFSITMNDLTPATTYYVKAYATNRKGTSYGSLLSFTTAYPTGIPYVTTNTVTSITQNSAVCGGNIPSDGGFPVLSRGVCWSTASNPTVTNSKTVDGSGTGSFTSSITNVQPGITYYVRAYATNVNGTYYGSNVSFTVTGIPAIVLNRSSLHFGALMASDNPSPQTVMISNSGSGTLRWSAVTSHQWITVSPQTGTGDTTVTVSVNQNGLDYGAYGGTITFTAENASNSPQTVNVVFSIYPPGTSSEPFGDFATPADGSSVFNSVPITGWALDDLEVKSVKIYNGDTYIGDAVFVEGARPDVEAAFPDYPNNTKAGWGYMLLTNFLPNGGNGTYTITAEATDTEGHVVTLGSKTINIDNAHATKPFGAIDLPMQGETISSSMYINFGWALTPQPNTIPTDGSTIEVIIDGVVQGHAGYNQLRSDIAELFPGLNNTNGAGGYYYFNPLTLKNGLHSMVWNVTDNKGNSDGIGSRYFTVMNTGSDSAVASVSPLPNNSKVTQSCISMNECNTETIEIKELERLEIRFADLPNAPTHNLSGYLVVNDQLRECPVGSTLDNAKGIFYWQPGPGFVGEYHLLFTGEDENGQSVQKRIIVNIKPRF